MKLKFPFSFTPRKMLRALLLLICAVILGLKIYSINANTLLGNQLPMPFGYGVAVVLSGSMEPVMSEGDLIIITEAEEYVLRDIVVYQDKSSLVVHRIIEINGEEIITMGDANPDSDAPISVKAIKGKVVSTIPYVGTIVKFLKSPLGTLLILALAVLLLELPHRNEKKKDDLERQKILDEINRLKNEL